MEATKEKTCQERIEAELKGRIADFEKALKGDYSFQGDGYEYEDFIEFINSYALAYEDDPHNRGKRLELSYVGPQDYFVFFEDGTITYHFLDWFDGAEKTLYGHDLEVMEAVRDYLTG